MLNELFLVWFWLLNWLKWWWSISGRGWVGHGCDAVASNGKYLECEGWMAESVDSLFAPVKMLLIARRSLSDGLMYVLRDCTFRWPVTDMIPILLTPASQRLVATIALMQWLVYLLLRPASAERRGMKSYSWLTPIAVLPYHTAPSLWYFERGFWNKASLSGFNLDKYFSKDLTGHSCWLVSYILGALGFSFESTPWWVLSASLYAIAT